MVYHAEIPLPLKPNPPQMPLFPKSAGVFQNRVDNSIQKADQWTKKYSDGGIYIYYPFLLSVARVFYN